MKFFKHFTDSHRGNSLQSLFEKMGHVGVACYWILVEMCAEKLDKNPAEEFTESHCNFQFHEKILRQNLRISRTNVGLFLEYCQSISLLSFRKSETVFNIAMPKLLESLDRDTKRARTVRATAAPKIKKKIKNKEEDKEEDKDISAQNDSDESFTAEVIPEFSKIEKIILERKISKTAQQNILQAFPEPEWVISEIYKMIAWESTNPGKRKKNFARFAMNWLTRSWDSRRHAPTSFNKADQRTANNRAAGEAYLKTLKERGES